MKFLVITDLHQNEPAVDWINDLAIKNDVRAILFLGDVTDMGTCEDGRKILAKFKKETGQSVSSYIRYAKAERAKLLLESTDLSVREIAERLAFNTVNYFIQCFLDTTGYTPAQYRKRFRGA